MIKVSENQMPWDDISGELVRLNAINKVKYILNKHGYRVDKKLTKGFKNRVVYYRKGSIQDDTLQCVTVRHSAVTKENGMRHEQTIISFDQHIIHATEYSKAYYIIDEIYNEAGGYLNLYYHGISFDKYYDDIIKEINQRLYKLKRTWR
jgi:hypothetical protein